MAVNKRYYWLKLKDDFFNDKRIKRLRKIAGGDTYTIIYLKILLLSLKNGGKLYFEGVEENFVSELALDIDEEEDNVTATVAFLLKQGLLVEGEEPDEYVLNDIPDLIGSESASTRRSRKSREQKVLQCNTNATLCNTMQQNCNGDIDIDIDIDIDYYKEIQQLFKKYNIEKSSINNIIKTLRLVDKDIDYLKEKIEFTKTTILNKEKSDIKSNVGLLIEAIKNDWKATNNNKIKNNKSKFHNFEQVISNNYSNEDLEKLIANNTSKKGSE